MVVHSRGRLRNVTLNQVCSGCVAGDSSLRWTSQGSLRVGAGYHCEPTRGAWCHQRAARATIRDVFSPPSGSAARFLQRPAHSLPALLAVALCVEIGQYVPEMFVGAHAIGEVVRNLSYALVGAVVFQWLVVEVPAARRRRATYEFSRMTFQLLLSTGPGLLYQYQKAAEVIHEPLDVWDQGSLRRLAVKLDSLAPDVFGPQRAALLNNAVTLALPRALADLSASASYLDPDVAHAVSQFPRQDGITLLQVQRSASGGVVPHSDVHVTWTLLEAARRLYTALLKSGAYDADVFQATVGDPPFRLSAEVLRETRSTA